MSSPVPRLRMFAGPNGSGKSTIKSVIPPSLLGVYINPDEIEDGIRLHGFVDLQAFNVETVEEEIFRFLAASPLLQKSGLCQEAQSLQFSDGRLIFQSFHVNSYFASVIADFLRQKLIEKRVSFTFETVMSSADKVRLLKKAQGLGYRTYIYYVATEDPIINISRVKSRVKIMGACFFLCSITAVLNKYVLIYFGRSTLPFRGRGPPPLPD